jgi:[acyl-carrier-protein] S-malonyltransferase
MPDLVAILCSGQGGQHPGMFNLVASSPEAEPVFTAAAGVLGQDPRRFVREVDLEDLFADRAAQILCCTRILAAWAALGTARPERAVIASYSAGELPSWACAGALDVPDTLRLAERRAAMMDAAAPSDGGLAAIIGLDRPTLEPILAGHAVSIAIVDDVDFFVVGGRHPALEAVCQEAAAHGATRTLMLRVGVPGHTPLLREATLRFRAALREASPRLPRTGYRLLSGIDGNTVFDIETGIDKLARQISSTIDWAACLETCRSAGAAAALEIGPGTALSHMASARFPDGRVRAVDEFRSVAGLQTWLQRAMG